MSESPSSDDLAKSFEEFEDRAVGDPTVGKEKTEFAEEGNNGTFVSISREPRSLEEHLAAYGVDLKVWKVDKWVANQWEMATSRIGGRITAVPIYQTKAWLSRIKLEAVLFPEITPVEFKLYQTWCPPLPPTKASGVKRAIIVPDIQTGFSRDFRTGRMEPFHDRRALDVVLQVAEHMQPDVIVFNGDDVDLPDWSDKYVRSPEMYFTSQASLAECAWWKAQFRLACPHADIHWIEGNHECIFYNTEVLTDRGWTQAEFITMENRLACYKLDTGVIEFHRPTALSRQDGVELFAVRGPMNDDLVSHNHRLDVDNQLVKAEELLSSVDTGRFRHSGRLDEVKELPVSDDMLRLMVWAVCDGTIWRGPGIKCRVQFKLSKPRKIERLGALLRKLGIKHSCLPVTGKSRGPLNKLQPWMIRFHGDTARSFDKVLEGHKAFDQRWRWIGRRQLEIVLEEIRNTDGSYEGTKSFDKFRWTTTDVDSAENIQLACVTSGLSCKIDYDTSAHSGFTQSNAKPQVKVHVGGNGYGERTSVGKVARGTVIALTTPLGTLVTRRNGKVSFTGNSRMQRAILVHNVASYDLRSYDDLDGHAQMSMQKLCALDKIGVQYHGPYPHGEVWLGDKFRIVHGETVRSQSGKTVAKMTEDLRHSEVQGHIHRVELACKTYWKKEGSRTYMAASFGTMARIAPGVVPGFKSRQNWQNGFGVVEFEEGGEGLYNVRPVLVFDGCTVYDGSRWTGRSEADIVRDIQGTLGDKVRVA